MMYCSEWEVEESIKQDIEAKKNPKTVCVDFDGVIAEYDHWRGAEHFGAPLKGAREALKQFRDWGWRINIFTTRIDTHELRQYLKFHDIPYDVVNSIAHNPDGCSIKPIAEVYLDDRSWYDVKRKWNWKKVMRRMRKLYSPIAYDSIGGL